jgi:hypothetical protein
VQRTGQPPICLFSAERAEPAGVLAHEGSVALSDCGACSSGLAARAGLDGLGQICERMASRRPFGSWVARFVPARSCSFAAAASPN